MVHLTDKFVRLACLYGNEIYSSYFKNSDLETNWSIEEARCFITTVMVLFFYAS